MIMLIYTKKMIVLNYNNQLKWFSTLIVSDRKIIMRSASVHLFFFKWLFWIILGNKYGHVLKNICETCYCGHFFINLHYIWSFLLFRRWSKAGLPFLNFQMGFSKFRMGYGWDTISFAMRYVVEVRNFSSKKDLLTQTTFRNNFFLEDSTACNIYLTKISYTGTFFHKKTIFLIRS